MAEYELPDPEKKPVGCVVLSYKTLKGVQFDDRAWDRVHWNRNTKPAKELLDICGSLRAADTCMVELGKGFNEKGFSWTLETIVKHAHDWVQKKRGGLDGNAAMARKRFFEALAKQRTSGKTESPGAIPSAREILNSLGGENAPKTPTDGQESGTPGVAEHDAPLE